VDAVARFVSEHPVEHQLWTAWDRALPLSSYDFEKVPVGVLSEQATRFPHPIRTWDEWQTSPLSDEYLAQMALDVATRLHFGTEDRTDLLAISFSALDLVGHLYGPNSHEVQDVLVRLDRTLGSLLADLDRLVGKDNYVVALTSDHGVAPTPERSAMTGLDAGRIPPRAIPDAVQEAVHAAIGVPRSGARLMNGDLYLDRGIMDRLRSKPGAVTAVIDAIQSVAGVERAYSRDELDRLEGVADPTLDRIRKSYVPARSGDIFVVFKPYWLVGTNNNANHGTVYSYDSRVPIILAGPTIKAGEYVTPVTPLDIAPTLAYLTGITLPRAQGHVLAEALSHPVRPDDQTTGMAPVPRETAGTTR
jgi:predicted AlkP superfamily pyrophosphatase or phosphodiesterase